MKKVILTTTSGVNDLATLAPLKASYWHKTKNLEKVTEVSPGTRRKAWWSCSNNHEWEENVRKFYSRKKYDCLRCSSLAALHPHLAKEWSKENKLDPWSVYEKSSLRVLWECSSGHSWETTVGRRVRENGVCPTCSGYRLNVGLNDLATTHPHIAREWDYSKNRLKPNEISYSSHEEIWWKCKEGHTWKQSCNSRVTKIRQVCLRCFPSGTSMLEMEIAQHLKGVLPKDELIHERYRGLEEVSEVDFFIPNKRIAIEVNGIYWHSEEMLAKRSLTGLRFHSGKREKCSKQGVGLYFIWEDDWKKQRSQVEKALNELFAMGSSTADILTRLEA